MSQVAATNPEPAAPEPKQALNRELVAEMLKVTGLSASSLATGAGLAATTLTRFFREPDRYPLSDKTMEKLRVFVRKTIDAEVNSQSPRSEIFRYLSREAQITVRHLQSILPEKWDDLPAETREMFTSTLSFMLEKSANMRRIIGEATQKQPQEFIDDFALIPVYDVRASAGPGAAFDSELQLYDLAFRRQWLRSATNAPLEQLVVLQASGDSMEPTIYNGDTMLVDRTQLDPRYEGIYVIRWDDATNVKRVAADYGSKRLTVSSDNARYPVAPGVRPEDLTIIGRVIWIGRRVA